MLARAWGLGGPETIAWGRCLPLDALHLLVRARQISRITRASQSCAARRLLVSAVKWPELRAPLCAAPRASGAQWGTGCVRVNASGAQSERR